MILYLAFLRQLYFLKDHCLVKYIKHFKKKIIKLFTLPEDIQWRKSFHELFHFLHRASGFGEKRPAEHQAHFLSHEAHYQVTFPSLS